MIQMAIEGMGMNPDNYRVLVLLKEQTGKRYLPIWIGSAEANAITVKLRGEDTPRPLSHDLLYSIISSLKASIDSIVVNELREDTFHARILLNTSEGRTDVDSRPSDALALAVRAEAPIFAEDTVLDKGGVLIDKKTGQVIPQQTSEEERVTEDELSRLSAFTDFISGLDIDDLGKGPKEE